MLSPSWTFRGSFPTQEPEIGTELPPSHPLPAVWRRTATRPADGFVRAALPPLLRARPAWGPSCAGAPEGRALREAAGTARRPLAGGRSRRRAGGGAKARRGGAGRRGAAVLTAAVAPGAGRGGAGWRRRAPVAPPRHGFHGEAAGRQGAAGRHGAADSADRSEPEPALPHGEGGRPGRGAEGRGAGGERGGGSGAEESPGWGGEPGGSGAEGSGGVRLRRGVRGAARCPAGGGLRGEVGRAAGARCCLPPHPRPRVLSARCVCAAGLCPQSAPAPAAPAGQGGKRSGSVVPQTFVRPERGLAPPALSAFLRICHGCLEQRRVPVAPFQWLRRSCPGMGRALRGVGTVPSRFPCAGSGGTAAGAARSGVTGPARLRARRLRERGTASECAPTTHISQSAACGYFPLWELGLLGCEQAACGRESERAGCHSWLWRSRDAGPRSSSSSRPAGSVPCTGRADLVLCAYAALYRVLFFFPCVRSSR